MSVKCQTHPYRCQSSHSHIKPTPIAVSQVTVISNPPLSLSVNSQSCQTHPYRCQSSHNRVTEWHSTVVSKNSCFASSPIADSQVIVMSHPPLPPSVTADQVQYIFTTTTTTTTTPPSTHYCSDMGNRREVTLLMGSCSGPHTWRDDDEITTVMCLLLECLRLHPYRSVSIRTTLAVGELGIHCILLRIGYDNCTNK